MDMMRVETGLKRKKTPGEQFTPITGKINWSQRKAPRKESTLHTANREV